MSLEESGFFMKILVLLMGVLDLNAAIVLLALAFGSKIPLPVLIFTIVTLFLKACISLKDIGSVIDLFAITLIILGAFIVLPFWIFFIAAFFVGLKGIRSFGA